MYIVRLNRVVICFGVVGVACGGLRLKGRKITLLNISRSPAHTKYINAFVDKFIMKHAVDPRHHLHTPAVVEHVQVARPEFFSTNDDDGGAVGENSNSVGFMLKMVEGMIGLIVGFDFQGIDGTCFVMCVGECMRLSLLGWFPPRDIWMSSW